MDKGKRGEINRAMSKQMMSPISESQFIPHGTPQGSVCSPVLQLLVYNFLLERFRGLSIYADDLDFVSTIKGERALLRKLSMYNQVLAQDKTVRITPCSKGPIIVKYLGLVILFKPSSSSLSFTIL